MCLDNQNRISRFMNNLFADAAHKKLINRTSTLSTNDNHIYIQVRRLLTNYFYLCAVHKNGRSVQA
jgi:hypothetical protein